MSKDHQEAITAAIEEVKRAGNEGLIPDQIVGRLERLRGEFEHDAVAVEEETVATLEERIHEIRTNKEAQVIADELGVEFPEEIKKVADKVEFLAAHVEGEDAGSGDDAAAEAPAE